MLALIIDVGRIVHPCWVRAVVNVSHFSKFFCCGFVREHVVAVGEFYELYFEIWLGDWWHGHGCYFRDA